MDPLCVFTNGWTSGGGHTTAASDAELSGENSDDPVEAFVPDRCDGMPPRGDPVW